LRAADPDVVVRNNLRVRGRRLTAAGETYELGRGRLVLVAAGKAAVAMARAAEGVLGDWISDAIAVAPPGPRPALRRTHLMVAGHPVPDAHGAQAAEAVLALARGLEREDLLLVLLSGGASALLPAPVAGLGLEEKASVTALLMRAGATIHELNTVRKHLSRIKGGGLARAAAPARVACLVLSDVVGDDLSTIASGPTVPDPTTYADAVDVLRRRGVWDETSAAIRGHLEAGVRAHVPETAKPEDAFFARVSTRIVGNNAIALAAAEREARRHGLRAHVLTTRLEGEAREASRVLVAVLRECVGSGRPARPPVCLLAGGETTVTVRGPGRGGRNQEIAVAAVEPLSLFPAHAVVASLATDGVDGKSDAAGGVVDQETAREAASLGLAPPAAFLAASDSTSFLGPVGGLIVTGPTGTNVMDLTVLLAGDPRSVRR
jgi:hydroxypyruvate reductase